MSPEEKLLAQVREEYKDSYPNVIINLVNRLELYKQDTAIVQGKVAEIRKNFGGTPTLAANKEYTK